MATADVDIAGAAATTLKEAASPAEHSDYAATTCTSRISLSISTPHLPPDMFSEKTQKERREI